MKTLLLKTLLIVFTTFCTLSCSKKEETPNQENLLVGEWTHVKSILRGEEISNDCLTPWVYSFNDRGLVTTTISLLTVNNCKPSNISFRYTLEGNKLVFKSGNILTDTMTIDKLTETELTFTKENGITMYFTRK